MSIFLVDPSTVGQVKVNSTEDDPNLIPMSVVDSDGDDGHDVAALTQFWPKAIEEIGKIGNSDFQTPALPLARIKKVMKLDDNVKMISAEAPMLFSKAAEIFIKELTLRAWIHTDENRRRTLLKNDISMAIAKYDQFDFLIDIVPREEAKTVTNNVKTSLNPEQVQYYFKLAQQQQQQQQTNNTSGSSAGQTIQILQPVNNQVVSLGNGTQGQVNIENIPNNTSNIASTSTTVTGSQPQIIQLQGNTQALNTNSNSVIQFVQQVITPTGEVQHIPIQMLQMPIQNSP